MPKQQTFREYVLVHDPRQWPQYGLGDFINDLKDDPDFDPQSLDEDGGLSCVARRVRGSD